MNVYIKINKNAVIVTNRKAKLASDDGKLELFTMTISCVHSLVIFPEHLVTIHEEMTDIARCAKVEWRQLYLQGSSILSLVDMSHGNGSEHFNIRQESCIDYISTCFYLLIRL